MEEQGCSPSAEIQREFSKVVRQGGVVQANGRSPQAVSMSDGIQFMESRANLHLDPVLAIIYSQF